MEFESFEHALEVCMTAEDGSPEQDAALLYCLEKAPPELREKLEELHEKKHGHGCGCGGHD